MLYKMFAMADNYNSRNSKNVLTRRTWILRWSLLLNVVVLTFMFRQLFGEGSGGGLEVAKEPVTEKDLEERLRSTIQCYDRPYETAIVQHGDFWVLKNYIRAEHGHLKCHESITYTTHADYSFLNNLVPVLERWNAPLSIAMHAPGTDFQPTLDSIRYLRDCHSERSLVRKYATFHVYFSAKHIPENIPKYKDGYNCALPAPYANITHEDLYTIQNDILYPINVGRNIARDATMTHFVLATDIEMYPSPGLVPKFLEMIARTQEPSNRDVPRVYPLAIFEVQSIVPRNKTELQELLRLKKAIPFHDAWCDSALEMPHAKAWMAAGETDDLSVFHIGKRIGPFVHWEPIYIGTHAEPHYDERLSWDGKSDRLTHSYTLCVLDYEFHILNNAFLVHKPGIEIYQSDIRRDMLADRTDQLLSKTIFPELEILYGSRPDCDPS